jgi:thiol-disulfide isomerase/thioredoxin
MSTAKRGFGFGEIIGFGLLAVVLAMLAWPRGGSAEPVPKGTPLPELMAEGWLNTDEPSISPSPQDFEKVASPSTGRGIPSRENLRGKVVVVDCWATWCMPCRIAMPKLAKLYKQYGESPVEFVGLTSEIGPEVTAVEQFVASVDGFDWPVGYGAGVTQDMLGIQLLPTLVVFDKSGVSTWSSTSSDGLAAAIDEALAR